MCLFYSIEFLEMKIVTFSLSDLITIASEFLMFICGDLWAIGSSL